VRRAGGTQLVVDTPLRLERSRVGRCGEKLGEGGVSWQRRDFRRVWSRTVCRFIICIQQRWLAKCVVCGCCRVGFIEWLCGRRSATSFCRDVCNIDICQTFLFAGLAVLRVRFFGVWALR